MRKRISVCTAILLMVLLAGCQKQTIQIGRQTDLLIIGHSTNRLKVAGCLDGELTELGEIGLNQLNGWTLTLYDGWDNCGSEQTPIR